MGKPKTCQPPSQPVPAGGTAVGAVVECDTLKLVKVVEFVPGDDTDPNGPVYVDEDYPVEKRPQYVNLSVKGVRQLDRAIRLRARVAWESGRKDKLRDHSVRWYFVPDGENRASLMPALRAQFLDTPTRTHSDGWTDVATLRLSNYGGDRFKAFAMLDTTHERKPAGEYRVWRVVSYKVYGMRRPSPLTTTYADMLDTSGLESELRRHYIQAKQRDFERTPGVKIAPELVRKVPHRRVMDKTPIARRSWFEPDGGSAHPWPMPAGSAAGNRRRVTAWVPGFHIVAVDTIRCDCNILPARTFLFPPGRNTMTLSTRSFLLDTDNWFESAQYSQGTRSISITTIYQGLTLEETGVYPDHKYVIKIDRKILGVEEALPFRISVKLKDWEEIPGFARDGTVFIAVGWAERLYRRSPAKRLKNALLSILFHEVCHVLGLAAQKLPDGKTNRHFDGRRDQPHCNALSGRCTMFPVLKGDTQFCHNCTDSLRGNDLNSLPSKGPLGV